MTTHEQATVTAQFQVEKAGLAGGNWATVFRGSEVEAKKVFQRQLQLYSVGRFRLIGPQGQILDDRKAQPKFSFN